MVTALLVDPTSHSIPVWGVAKSELGDWLQGQPAAWRRWVEASGFEAETGRHLLLPDAQGGIDGVLVGTGERIDLWTFAGLAPALPEGTYRIASRLDGKQAGDAALGFALGGYSFDRYRAKPAAAKARLAWPEGADREHVLLVEAAIRLARDLVNTPAQDMGPDQLAEAARRLASDMQARFRCIEGEELLKANYPMVHAVGRAASRAPRLIDLVWGEETAPKVTLVGKGVCFDSGGLDIKPASGMALMKKDMGGAANALALARMIMAAGLKIRLRLLIPAVENAISGDAFRPGDILVSRAGISVEIGNTDAEGRLILADALAEADSERPDLLLDFATLTGAARVAVGPDLPAFYCDDDAFVEELGRHARAESDPFWRLPLWQPYRTMLDSKVADINNAGEGGFAGSITAALFLKEFVKLARCWAHFDLFAWNPKARPGRPQGGEAMSIRALFALLAERYPAE
ncbi:MAG: leucyl aminopeptidase family protein [Alphaproteobacteria bacterium]|nr:leucyl aminopeptidase family protein [Alphaproteobacteria bacterium]